MKTKCLAMLLALVMQGGVTPACAANFPVGHGGTYRQPHGGEFTVVALAWLDWQLKNKAEGAKMFKGKDNDLQKRKDWTLEKNAKME